MTCTLTNLSSLQCVSSVDRSQIEAWLAAKEARSPGQVAKAHNNLAASNLHGKLLNEDLSRLKQFVDTVTKDGGK